MNTIQINNECAVITGNDFIIINGKKYKKPGYGNSLSVVDKKIYINGYEFKDGKFKRTLKAMWNLFF